MILIQALTSGSSEPVSLDSLLMNSLDSIKFLVSVNNYSFIFSYSPLLKYCLCGGDHLRFVINIKKTKPIHLVEDHPKDISVKLASNGQWFKRTSIKKKKFP